MKKSWRVPVLTYHAIGEGPSPLFTPVDVFESHLEALEASGLRAFSLSALLDGLRQNDSPPERAVVLTFDDGYETVATHAWPRLRDRGFGATVFLVTEYCGGDNQWPTQDSRVPARPLMSWDQAARLAGEGAELGAHSRTHHPLSELPERRSEEEMAGSKAEIERRTGQRARTFAYPYGARNAATEAIARRHFDGAVSADLGLFGPAADPFQIPRVDSYYLSARAIRRLTDPLFRGSLVVRQILRSSRRWISPDWRSSSGRHNGNH